jgi:hypothetical protein
MVKGNNMKRKFILDYEAVESITKGNLSEIYRDISHDLEDAALGTKYMHPYDMAYYTELLPALAKVLYHFGEKV